MGMREEVRYGVVPGDACGWTFYIIFLSSHRVTMENGRIITIFGGGRVAPLKIDTGCGCSTIDGVKRLITFNKQFK